MRKIFAVALGAENGVYTELTLPATPYVMLDALEKLRLEAVEKADWELTGCFVTGELARRLDPEGKQEAQPNPPLVTSFGFEKKQDSPPAAPDGR